MITELIVNFMASKSDIQNNLYISKKPHQIYPRKFLVTKELIEVRDFLNEEIPKIQNSDFITLLNRYGLER